MVNPSKIKNVTELHLCGWLSLFVMGKPKYHLETKYLI